MKYFEGVPGTYSAISQTQEGLRLTNLSCGALLCSCVSSFGQAGSSWRSEGGRAEQISLVLAKNMCGWDPLPCWIPCVDTPFSSLFWFVATLILTLTVASAQLLLCFFNPHVLN